MNGPYNKCRSGPLHSLSKVQADIALPTFAFASGVIRNLRAGIGDWSEKECRSQIRKLISELNAEDFAWIETIRHASTKQTINCDVYGKKDVGGVWYIKFAVVGSALLFSCHLAENDMELKNGKILRVHHDD